MSSLIKNIIPISQLKDDNAPYITIIHPHQKPPHIGFTINGVCYSLSVKGKKSLNVNSMISKFLSSGKQILFIKIDVNENESFINIFERFNNVHFNLSCLTPIKEYLEVNLNDDFHHLPFVFNVISKLNVENKITEAFGVNLKGDFQLTEYSKEDIDNCIVTYLKNRL